MVFAAVETLSLANALPQRCLLGGSGPEPSQGKAQAMTELALQGQAYVQCSATSLREAGYLFPGAASMGGIRNNSDTHSFAANTTDSRLGVKGQGLKGKEIKVSEVEDVGGDLPFLSNRQVWSWSCPVLSLWGGRGT